MLTRSKQLQKLADLMREGSKMSGPLRNAFYRDGGDKLKACALGAVYLALKGNATEMDSGRVTSELSQAFPVMNRTVVPPKGTGFGPADLTTTVINLNDSKRWGRTKIADYLECLAEPKPRKKKKVK